MTQQHPLEGCVVVDLSSDIAGGYCTKLLADGGAEVVKVEDPTGDRLRSWSASGAAVDPTVGSPLFQYLAASKRSVVVDAARDEDVELVHRLTEGADLVVWSPGSEVVARPDLHPESIRELAPFAVVLAVSPFGLAGEWAARAATDATLSAWSGGTGQRGSPEHPPISVGGRLTEWCGGMVAGLAALIAREQQLRRGQGELVDVSLLEAAVLTQTMHPVTFASIAGFPMIPERRLNLPGIHATNDGYVGFMVVTGQQWLDFCAMLERTDWLEDESLIRMQVRAERASELLDVIDDWMVRRTTDEVVELASLLRIPVAEIGNGATVPTMDHFVDRGWYVQNPGGGFLQPDVPYTLGSGAARRSFERAPRLGEHTDDYRRTSLSRRESVPDPGRPGERPFEGLKVADFTAFWAGPIVGNILGMFGADVVHVESAERPDGMRFNTVKAMSEPAWWEWSPLFHGPNTDKRDLTLDLRSERGRELARRLIAEVDVVLENYSPRVMEGWGFDAESVRAINPRAIYVRMPAFGTTGPWRDRVGYAQTMEQISGLAWVTGYPDQPPVIPNGPCDPIGGCHATVALLLALEHRRRTGQGMLVECPQVGGALNVAAEVVIEHSANGVVVNRGGNRSPNAAPQGLYLTADVSDEGHRDRWVCISVETDEQWDALRSALGSPSWTDEPSFRTAEGRRAAHDAIDDQLSAWCAPRLSDEIVDLLWTAGVPTAKVILPHEQIEVPQLWSRGFFEEVEHVDTGCNLHSGFPARFESVPPPIHRDPAPRLGEHNAEVLPELGLTEREIQELVDEGTIGDTSRGDAKAF